MSEPVAGAPLPPDEELAVALRQLERAQAAEEALRKATKKAKKATQRARQRVLDAEGQLTRLHGVDLDLPLTSANTFDLDTIQPDVLSSVFPVAAWEAPVAEAEAPLPPVFGGALDDGPTFEIPVVAPEERMEPAVAPESAAEVFDLSQVVWSVDTAEPVTEVAVEAVYEIPSLDELRQEPVAAEPAPEPVAVVPVAEPAVEAQPAASAPVAEPVAPAAPEPAAQVAEPSASLPEPTPPASLPDAPAEPGGFSFSAPYMPLPPVASPPPPPAPAEAGISAALAAAPPPVAESVPLAAPAPAAAPVPGWHEPYPTAPLIAPTWTDQR